LHKNCIRERAYQTNPQTKKLHLQIHKLTH